MEWYWVSGLMAAMYFLGSFVTWYIIRMDRTPDDTEQRMWGKVHEAQTAFYESGHDDGWEEALHAAREAVAGLEGMSEISYDYPAYSMKEIQAAIDALEKP